MQPTWQTADGAVKLWCADCLDVLPTLEAGSVDAVVTDPPYGIGFKYESHNDSPEGYGEWLWRCLELAEATCSTGCPIFVWQAMPNLRWFAVWFPREYRIFAAAKNFVQMRPIAMQFSYDPVIVWWTDGERWSAGTATRDFHIANTAPVIARPDNIEREHPCPRPLDQIEHIVSQWVRPNSRCLDPFMGSGTTGVACVRTGRKFLGIEKEPKYFEIAIRRIEAELNRAPLFDEPPVVQRTLID